MAATSRSGIIVLCLIVCMTLHAQNSQKDGALEGVPSGKTRVIDLSYAINDKLVPWPGDTRWFEAKVNATVEKTGYSPRSSWLRGSYGPHLTPRAPSRP